MIQTEYGTGCWTKYGERVRSKKEKTIADFLYSERIDYIYEYPLQLGCGGYYKGLFEWNYLKYPDFYLPAKDVYIEYLGIWSKERYKNMVKKKRKLYERYNIPCIYLFEEDLYNLKEVVSNQYKFLKKDKLFTQDNKFKYEKIINNTKKELFGTLSTDLINFRKNIISINEHIKAYEVFQNKAIRYLIYHLPKTKEELKQIEGITQENIERYGNNILSIIREKQKHPFYFAQGILCKDK